MFSIPAENIFQDAPAAPGRGGDDGGGGDGAMKRNQLASSGAMEVERRSSLTHAEFVETYRHKRPVVLSGFATEWAALAHWSDVGHLRTRLDEDVLIMRSPDNRQFIKRECEHFDGPFSRVVDMLFDPSCAPPPGQRLYARAPLAGGLRAESDLSALEELVGGVAGSHCFKDAKCGVWLGSAGCVTPLHYDLCHGFLVGVLGAKHFTYYAPEDFRSLFPRPDETELSRALELNLEAAKRLSGSIDALRRLSPPGRAQDGGDAEAPRSRFPEPTGRAWHATVLPGDVLYTPPYWWHHVETEAEHPALSVLVPWDPTSDEPVHECMCK